MLSTPLHHCYLVPAQSTSSCLKALEKKLEELSEGSNSPFYIERFMVETLTIELARELRDRGQQRATGEARCLILGFDVATTEAQNALLKIIENPADGIHFFFVTPAVSNLLETVRSRSWLLSDICEGDSSANKKITDVAESFLTAEGLAERLKAIEQVQNKDELRSLVQVLSQDEAVRKNSLFGQAVELVADYGQDVGASVKLLQQYLAVAAGSPKEK